MTADRDALLAAVVAAPDDDLPRLAFADWLDEHGDPARAEFIRLQCRLAAAIDPDPPSGPDFMKMKSEFDRLREAAAADRPDLVAAVDRCRDLYAEHGRRWRAELPAGASQMAFHRGFLAAAEMKASAFATAGDRLLSAAPLETVWLRDLAEVPEVPRPDVDGIPPAEREAALERWADEQEEAEQAADRSPGVRAVATSPHLRRLRRLDVSMGELSTDQAVELLTSPHLGDLIELNLGDNAVGRAGAEAVARCPRLSGLRTLRLMSAEIGPSGVRALAASPHLGELRRLELSGNRLGDRGVRAVAGSSRLANLEELDVGSNGLTADGVAALGRASGLGRLRKLGLSYNDIGDAAIDALAGSPLAPRLRSLNLMACGIQAAGRIATAPGFAGLEELSLEVYDGLPSQVDAAAAAAFGQSPHLGNLKSLTLTHSQFGDAGAEGLAAGDGLTGLRSLKLDGCSIGPTGVAALARADKFGRLRRLELSTNPMGPAGAAALAASRSLAGLRAVTLQECDLGDDGVLALLSAPWLANVSDMNLCWNGVTDRAAVTYARHPAFAALTDFDLSDGVGDPTAAAIARSPHAAGLRWLSLGPQMTDDGCRELAASPHLGRLESLILTENNAVTEAGLVPLWRRFGRRVVHGGRQPPADLVGPSDDPDDEE